MHLKILKTLLLTVLIIYLSAFNCFALGEKEQKEMPLKDTEGKAELAISVTDSLGRSVSLSSIPERIISLSPSTTEILFAVGAGDQVVGVTNRCDFPPEAKTRNIVGGFSVKTISIEKILSLEPDIVFSGGAYHQTVIDALIQAGIIVYAVDAQSFEEVYGVIEAIGSLTGHPDKTAERIDYMKGLESQITQITALIPEEKRARVFWEIWDNPFMTAGPGTAIGQVITKAGGINIFQDVEQDYPAINVEEIIARNPDVIMGPDNHEEALTSGNIIKRTGWNTINAVKEEMIYILDGNITSRPGPRIVNALGLVFRALYPEAFRSVFDESDPAKW